MLGAAGVAPYPVTVRTYNDSAGKPILEAWVIQGLSHNYSGGSFAGSYTDPFGPDITSAMWAFFESHAITAQSAGASLVRAPARADALPATGSRPLLFVLGGVFLATALVVRAKLRMQ